MEIPEKVRNSERHAHGWKDREISERMSIRTTMFRFAGKSPKIWKKSDHGESPVRPEKARSPMEKVRNGEIPMGKVRKWKKPYGKSPMEKVRWKPEKVRWKKSGPAGKSPAWGFSDGKSPKSGKSPKMGHAYTHFFRNFMTSSTHTFSARSEVSDRR